MVKIEGQKQKEKRGTYLYHFLYYKFHEKNFKKKKQLLNRQKNFNLWVIQKSTPTHNLKVY